jgi:hypothetical protein
VQAYIVTYVDGTDVIASSHGSMLLMTLYLGVTLAAFCGVLFLLRVHHTDSVFRAIVGCLVAGTTAAVALLVLQGEGSVGGSVRVGLRALGGRAERVTPSC